MLCNVLNMCILFVLFIIKCNMENSIERAREITQLYRGICTYLKPINIDKTYTLLLKL